MNGRYPLAIQPLCEGAPRKLGTSTRFTDGDTVTYYVMPNYFGDCRWFWICHHGSFDSFMISLNDCFTFTNRLVSCIHDHPSSEISIYTICAVLIMMSIPSSCVSLISFIVVLGCLWELLFPVVVYFCSKCAQVFTLAAPILVIRTGTGIPSIVNHCGPLREVAHHGTIVAHGDTTILNTCIQQCLFVIEYRAHAPQLDDFFYGFRDGHDNLPMPTRYFRARSSRAYRSLSSSYHMVS